MVAVATDLQPQWALSNSFAIRGSIITPPLVEVKPNIVGELASYSIKFKTSSSGRLGSCSGGYIMVEFPYGTKIPQTIKPEHVTINGVYCSSYEPLVNGRTVKLYPGMVVLEESDVEIIFTDIVSSERKLFEKILADEVSPFSNFHNPVCPP